MFHGMMTIYKEPGYTSSDVVARLRGILHMKKIGHTGTLDPDAEGVLPVCLGNGTKLCELIADRDKEYEAVMRLGVVTDTQDMSGEVLERITDEEVSQKVTPDDIMRTAALFTGEIHQIPPMYSAVKVGGKRLYQLAREGKTVERAARNEYILPVDSFFDEAPRAHVREEGMRFLKNGNTIRRKMTDLPASAGSGYVRMYDCSEKFYALYEYDRGKDELRCVKMFLS